MKVSLNSEKHLLRDVVLVFRSQGLEQMSMAAPPGNICRAFSPRVLVSTPSTQTYQAPNDRDWSTVPRGLVQRSVP